MTSGNNDIGPGYDSLPVCDGCGGDGGHWGEEDNRWYACALCGGLARPVGRFLGYTEDGMFEIFQSSKDSKWYWHLRARNHQIVATSGEGYESKTNCVRGLKTARELMGCNILTDLSQTDHRGISPIANLENVLW